MVMEQQFYLKDAENSDDSNFMQSIVSELLQIGESIREKYDVINASIKAFDVITEESVGINKLIEFDGNSELDRAHLRSLALTGLYESVHKDPSLITFQRSLLTLAFLKLMYKDFFQKVDYN
jgi:hypothetical protein